MKKVVFVVPVLAPYAILRFKEMAKDPNINIHVIVEQDNPVDYTSWHYQNIEGCQTYMLGCKETRYDVKHYKSGYSVNTGHKYSFGLKKLVKKIGPDIVIVCNSMQILFLLGPRKFKLGVIVEDTLRAEEGRRFINRLIKQILLKAVDFYIPFTEDAIAFLNHNGITSSMIRSSWSIDVDFFSDLADSNKRNEMRERLDISNKTNYTIVSSMISRKGLLQFIAAWSQMPKEFQIASELNLLGEGPLETEISVAAEKNKYKNINIRGAKSYQEVSHYLQCSDVFVLPTLEDLCSLVIFEAMASRLPVMTSIYNGARELIHDGINGYVFDSENIESMKKALLKMSNSNLVDMSKASEQIIKNYRNEVVIKKLVKQLQKI